MCKVFNSYPGRIQWKQVFKARNGHESITLVSPYLLQRNILGRASGFLNFIEWEIRDKLTAADTWFTKGSFWGGGEDGFEEESLQVLGQMGKPGLGQVTGMEMGEQL